MNMKKEIKYSMHFLTKQAEILEVREGKEKKILKL